MARTPHARRKHCLPYGQTTRNLNRLRQQAEELEPRLKAVFPKEGKVEKRAYELLRKAYVKARYSREYRITAEQLTWLGQRVDVLKQIVEQSCIERLYELQRAA